MLAFVAAALLAGASQETVPEHPVNVWVKRTPLDSTPRSPRLGYEGDCVWDPARRVILRYGGHNQGGGGEQNSEVWTCEPFSGRWLLKEPNTSPPGVCCAQQNVFDPVRSRYLRFPAFSGSHGWQWSREIYLNQSSVWSYDLDQNLWRNLRPMPTVPLSPLRCASWDGEHEVVVLFGGEGSRQGTLVYDPYTNTWAAMKPPLQPEFRSGGNMTYDAAQKVHVLFGTQFGNDPVTWGYDLRRNEWRDLKPRASPPARENDAVLKYDAVSKVVIAIVKQTEGKDEQAKHDLQTWAYDPSANTWKQMNPEREPDPSGSRARVLMAAPELNLIFLEDCPSRPREQQIWSYRFSSGKPPPAPIRLEVKTEIGAATVSWPPQAEPVSVLRGSGERPWEVEFEEIARAKAGEGVIRDSGLRAGTTYHYKLGVPSLRARTQPRPPEDLIVSRLPDNSIELAWKASPETDVIGYRAEISIVTVFSDDQLVRLKSRTPPLDGLSVGAVRSMTPFVPITSDMLKPAAAEKPGRLILPRPSCVLVAGYPRMYEGPLAFVREFGKEEFDPKGKPYPGDVFAYRVRAINALGVESGPSAAVLSVPSSPQDVFAREEGTTCRLRWSANAEKGLKGYRVYRMDGRYDKEPVTRLTPEPIAALAFSDPDAGRRSRRYYVVAVDALGQEGYPSSPAWFDREWKSFYAPFVGEWHQ